jgi:hypothetical protein
MSLPSVVENKFTEQFEGMRAARFVSASEAHNMENSLRVVGQSYRTKIIKSKRKGNSYLVMLVEPTNGH